MTTKDEKKNKVNITLSLDDDVNKDIEEIAEKMGLSKSAVANMMLRSVCFQETEILGAMLGAIVNQRKEKKKAARSPRKAVAMA